MDLLKLIKNRTTIRKYSDKDIPSTILKKIIDAGRWGPSIVNTQPFIFIVITNNKIIQQIANVVKHKSLSSGIGGGFILQQTAKTIANTRVLIAAYNTNEFCNRARSINESYASIAKLSEIQAVSGAIENMILMAEGLGIGSCWQDTPLLCEKSINEILGMKKKLIAVISFGYRAEEGRRTPRKFFLDVVKFIK